LFSDPYRIHKYSVWAEHRMLNVKSGDDWWCTRFENVILFRPIFFFIHQGDFRNSINVDLELSVRF
jgi:hypothetical protein